MPDPLLSTADLTGLEAQYEMGAAWVALDTAGRARIYRHAEAQWRAAKWLTGEDPFTAALLQADLRAGLAEHLRYIAGQGASTTQDPFPATTAAILLNHLEQPVEADGAGAVAPVPMRVALPPTTFGEGEISTLTEASQETLEQAARAAVDTQLAAHAAQPNVHHTPASGPAGPQGPQGATGAQGPKGDPGAAGSSFPDYSAGSALTENQNRNFSPAEVAEIADRVDADGVAAGGRIKQAIDAAVAAVPSGGAGLTDEQAAQLQSAVELEAAVRLETTLISAYAETVAISKAAYRIGNQSIPSAEADREMVIAIAGAGTASHRFDLTELAAKPLVTNAQQLSSANAIVFTDASGDSYYIAHASGGQLYFSADNVGSYRVTLTDSRINVTRYVDTASATRAGILSPTDFARIGTGGQTQQSGQTAQQVQAAIATHRAQPNAHHAPPTPRTWATLPGKPSTFPPALTDHQRDVFGAFRDGGWNNAAAILISAPAAARHTTANIAGAGYAATRTNASPNQVNRYVAVRVPIASRGVADAGDVRLAQIDSEGNLIPTREVELQASDFVRATSAYAYYSTLVPFLVASETMRPQELDHFELRGVDLPPAHIITVLADRQSQGIPMTSAASAQRLAPFDLQVNRRLGEDRGLVAVTVDWSIVDPVNVSLDASRLHSETIFTLSDLRSSPVYSASATNGIVVGGAIINRTSDDTFVAGVDLYIARDAQGDIVAYLNRYAGPNASGTQTATSIVAVFSVDLLLNDAPASAGSQGPAGPQGPKGDKGDKGDTGATGPAGATTFVGLTDTPSSLGTSGQVPAVNAAGNALEFVDAASGGGGGASITALGRVSSTSSSLSALSNSVAIPSSATLVLAEVTGNNAASSGAVVLSAARIRALTANSVGLPIAFGGTYSFWPSGPAIQRTSANHILIYTQSLSSFSGAVEFWSL